MTLHVAASCNETQLITDAVRIMRVGGAGFSFGDVGGEASGDASGEVGAEVDRGESSKSASFFVSVDIVGLWRPTSTSSVI